jgi:hypothetical protein
MAQTLYASFADASLAERAAGALLDHGMHNEDLSLISRERTGDYDANTEKRDYTTHTATMEERRTGYAGTAVAEPADADQRNADANYRADQRADQARANTEGATNRDWDTNANRTNPTWTDDPDRDSNTTVIDHTTGEGDKTELAAKQGLSTTTPGDAAAGAAKGAGIGLGVGILAALASIAIPGFGLVIGGGALATAIAGAAGATAAGAIAGGVHGYLKDQGVPDHVAMDYNKAYEHGSAILGVTVPSNNVDEVTVREILAKYGASNLNMYPTPAM